MAAPFSKANGQWVNLSASGLVKTGQGVLQKIICAASSTGVITVYDNTSAAGGNVILTSFPMTAGNIYDLDINFQVGCYISLSGSGTLTATYSSV